MSKQKLELEMDKTLIKTYQKLANIVDKPIESIIEYNLNVDLNSIKEGIKSDSFIDAAGFLNVNEKNLSQEQKQQLKKLFFKR